MPTKREITSIADVLKRARKYARAELVSRLLERGEHLVDEDMA
ncbi:MAG: hypothetical protein NTW87_14095 [Planctomycetota bacterium]|nr:hypothetical protein [Planctomycetota bacterium]